VGVGLGGTGVGVEVGSGVNVGGTGVNVGSGVGAGVHPLITKAVRRTYGRNIDPIDFFIPIISF
jgi:hypothetical protein